MIVIYTTDWCPSCVAAKKFFAEHSISYKEINIETKNISREDLQNISGNYTVPQIIINNHCIGGYSNLLELYQSKKLEKLLNEKL